MKSLIISGLSQEKELKERWEALDPKTSFTWLCEEIANSCEKNNLDINDAVDLLEQHIEKAERARR